MLKLAIYFTKITEIIRKYVANALRNFSLTPTEALFLVNEDRFVSVLKALAKSKNEDVLWQTSGILYNLMGFDACRTVMVRKLYFL